MRAFLAAVLIALAVAGGASLSAEAAPVGPFAGGKTGTSLALLARATFDDGDARPSRGWRKHGRHWKRPGHVQRYTKQRHAKQRHAKQRHARQRHARQRHATHGKRGWTRASRQARKGRVASGRMASRRSGRNGTRHAMRPGRIPVRPYPVQALPIGSDIVGVASYYWQGQRTATGAWFNPNGMTAAHRTLPFGTKVRVTHLGSGRSVVVSINDRGPYIGGRIIDLSKGAAGVLGMHQQGVARVRVTVLGR
jgi:rare lipoprotein A